MKTKSIVIALLTLVAAQSVLAAPVADQTEKHFIIVDRYYPPTPPRPFCLVRYFWRWFPLWP